MSAFLAIARLSGLRFFSLVLVPAALTVFMIVSSVIEIQGFTNNSGGDANRQRLEAGIEQLLAGAEIQLRELAQFYAVQGITPQISSASLYQYAELVEASASEGPVALTPLALASSAVGKTPFDIAPFIRRMKLDPGQSLSGIISTPQGLAILGAAQMPWPGVAQEPSGQSAQGKMKALVLVRVLDATQLASLGERFGVQGLRVLPNRPRGAAVSLKGPDGAPGGYLSWSFPDPANGHIKSAIGRLLVWLAIFFLISMALLFNLWKNVRAVRSTRAAVLWTSSHDALTGLPNRHHFSQHISPLSQKHFFLLFVSISRLGEVNDSYGYLTGDKLIRAVADGLVDLAPKESFVARLGGQEFVVELVGEDADEVAQTLAAKISDFLSVPFEFNRRIISANSTIALLGRDHAEGCTPDEILRRADAALYVARQEGLNRPVLYSHALELARQQRRELAAALRLAIRAGEINIVYQPYIAAASRKIVGAEALLRWSSAELGIVDPALFVSVAEEFGLIDELGAHVLHQACLQAAQWPHLSLSINVSPAQFINARFAAHVSSAIEAAGISGKQVELELTEGLLIKDPERARAIIAHLGEMGVSLSIDDFGTGYSSIGYLRNFNFSKLKIDRSLVSGLMTNPQAQKIIQGIVLISSAMNLRVTAEGIEHEEEAILLRACGVDFFQGYYFHRPMTALALDKLLAESRRTSGVTVPACAFA